jgi:hypothetical protein
MFVGFGIGLLRKWTGSERVATRRLQRPLATASEEAAAWTSAAASPAFRQVGSDVCGHR